METTEYYLYKIDDLYRDKCSHFNLAKMPTRQLLDWLHNAQACGGQWSPCDKNGPFVSVLELKWELATRPHIPNKKEAKALRKKWKKQGFRDK